MNKKQTQETPTTIQNYNYENGKKQGYCYVYDTLTLNNETHYYDNDNLIYKKVTDQYEKTLSENIYFSDSRSIQITYQYDHPDDPSCEYIKTISCFSNSQDRGVQIFYKEVGSDEEHLITTAEYISGMKQGIQTTYNISNGNIIETPYDKGKREGVELEFDSHKKLIRRSFYKNDQLNGVEIIFSATGQPMLINNYKDGIKVGVSLSLSQGTVTEIYKHEPQTKDIPIDIVLEECDM